MVIISFQRAPIIVRGKYYTDCADYIYSFQRGNAYRTTLEAREIALQDSRTILQRSPSTQNSKPSVPNYEVIRPALLYVQNMHHLRITLLSHTDF